ncbi:hypothetical protein NDU88_006700 [Pleurodeles waltl]|uniref:Uncharacterized protein n=1 Tax=Pleurodeles waltl TaxID=8319 RepID=A0AAV7X4T0_PLEWA|nr:hypothetical protein NDU88_006700 [Pleurodeles waltl]
MPAARSANMSVIRLIFRPRPHPHPPPLTASQLCQSLCLVPRPIPLSASVGVAGPPALRRPASSATTSREGPRAAGSAHRAYPSGLALDRTSSHLRSAPLGRSWSRHRPSLCFLYRPIQLSSS